MEDWKNDRAEADMKAHEIERMKESVAKFKAEAEKKEDDAWQEICQTLYVGDSEDDKNIDWVVEMIREKYNLPTKK